MTLSISPLIQKEKLERGARTAVGTAHAMQRHTGAAGSVLVMSPRSD